MKRVYIAGPIRGIGQDNFPAFDAAEETIRGMGMAPFSPARISREIAAENGIDINLVGLSSGTGHLLPLFMERDLSVLCHCDAIYLLPGWERSGGAKIEYALAKYLGLEVMEALP